MFFTSFFISFHSSLSSPPLFLSFRATDVFESNERLESPSATYVNTTLASNASSLGGHEPAPAHAQSLIDPYRDDVNGDVTNVDRGGDGVRVALAADDITVIEPTTGNWWYHHQ